MGVSSGGDNSNLLDALRGMMKQLEDKLNRRIDGITDDFIRRPEYEATVADVNSLAIKRKADMEEVDEKLAKLKRLIDNIKIPSPVMA